MIFKNKYDISSKKHKQIVKIIKAYLDKNKDLYLNQNQTFEEKVSLLGVMVEGYSAFEDHIVWDKRIHLLIKHTINDISGNTVACALHGGLANLGSVIAALHQQNGHYSNLLKKINERICRGIKKQIQMYNENSELTVQRIDLISGVSGVGNYLLNYYTEPQILLVIESIIRYLVGLIKYVNIEGERFPGWFIQIENEPLREAYEKYGKGYINYGISHGVTGVLAFLTNAYKCGIKFEGQEKAMQFIIDELFLWNSNSKGRLWAGIVSTDDYVNKTFDVSVEHQSWCNGNISVLFILHKATKLLKLTEKQHYVWERLKDEAKRDSSDYKLRSPIICHGYAGLTTIFRNLYEESGDEVFLRAAKGLLQIIVKKYDEKNKYGFQNERFPDRGIIVREDNNTFLDGAAGVVMELMAWTTDESYFEQLLLLK